jgi:serine O-acetyltransferase
MCGAGSIILGPILIGDGVKIGANELVRHDIPAGSVFVEGKIITLKKKEEPKEKP